MIIAQWTISEETTVERGYNDMPYYYTVKEFVTVIVDESRIKRGVR